MKMGTSRPSAVMPVMQRSAEPIIKSSWIMDSFTPRARAASGV